MPGPQVRNRGACDRERVDAPMRPKHPVFGGHGGRSDQGRDFVGGHPRATCARARPGFIENLAVTIEHDGRWLNTFGVQQSVRKGTEPKVKNEDKQASRGAEKLGTSPPAPLHLITTVAGADRPLTSGAYISSAHVPAAVNVPLVVARTRYEYSCVPSDRRVPKRTTRSSNFST